MEDHKLDIRYFIRTTLLVSIWVNISEVFRYFIIVMPRMKLFYADRDGIVDMSLGIFVIWGLWDTLLTTIIVVFFWFVLRLYGNSNRAVLLSGSMVWAAVFVIFWVAAANMGLSSWSILVITLPLSWVEIIVATWITSKLYTKNYG